MIPNTYIGISGGGSPDEFCGPCLFCRDLDMEGDGAGLSGAEFIRVADPALPS